MTTPAETVAATLLAVALILVLARLFGMLARRLHQPAVVGEIVAGIVLGPSAIGMLSWGGTTFDERFFPPEVTSQLLALANLGLVVFMFVIGLELDLRQVRSQRRQALSVSLTSVALPLASAAILAPVLWDHAEGTGPADRVAFALFIGVAMAVTAFPVLARILTERQMLRTPLGSLALAAAAVDDVVAWSLLAVATTVAGTGGHPAWVTILFSGLFVAVMVVVGRPFTAGLVRRFESAGRLTPNILSAVVVGILLSAWATEEIGIHFIFGAFVFGAVFPRGAADFVTAVLQRLEDVSVLLLLPVFFVVTGLQVRIGDLGGGDLLVLLLVVVLACLTKFVGSAGAARLTGSRPRTAVGIGVLMNTRGLTELVVVNVGLSAGLLDLPLYTVFVLMAVATTLMTEPLLRVVYPPEQVERDRMAAERAALGITDARRVLVAGLGRPEDAAALRVASDLLGQEHAGQVVWSRVVAPSGLLPELGSGLAAVLGGVADALEDRPDLRAFTDNPGLVLVPVTRTSLDPVGEWAVQADAYDVEEVVVAGEPDEEPVLRLLAECRRRVLVADPGAAASADWTAVELAGPGERAAPAAAFAVAVRLAAARSLPLALGGSIGGRRVTGWARRAREAGLELLASADAGTGSAGRRCVVAPVMGRGHPRPAAGRHAGPVVEDTALVDVVLVRAADDEPVDLLDRTFEALTVRRPVPSGASAPDLTGGESDGRHR